MSDFEKTESPRLISSENRRPRSGITEVPVGNSSSSSTRHDHNKNPQLPTAEGEKKKGKPSSASSLAQAKANGRKQKTAVSPPMPVVKDPLQPGRDAKDTMYQGTGVVYDMKMVEHRSLWDPAHPETPGRFSSIIERCVSLDLFSRCVSIPPRFATLSEITTAHTTEAYHRLEEICAQEDVEDLEESASRYDSVYFHPTTFDLALLACGSTIDLVQNVVEGKVTNGMAIVRPPGHHAMKNDYCGFCYFNNVSVAAHKALESGGAKRILIVDYDVHHGQATQQMFYDDPRVLYFSTHRFEHGTYWPNLEESNWHWIGTEAGLGFNCNIPLNTTGLENTDFVTVWYKILIPMAYQFQPDLVIVSAGYDAALGCPEGKMRVTPQCYPHLIRPLMALAHGKIAVILEGGYCLKSLAEGAALTLRTLLGDPCPVIDLISAPNPILVDTMLNTVSILKDRWHLLDITKSVSGSEFERNLESGTGHSPEYRFDWKEPKPQRFPTRDWVLSPSPETVKGLDIELDRLIMTSSLAVAKSRVGLVYDDEMLKHRNMQMTHPECPERISNIFACHVSFGLVERCRRIPARKATDDELRLGHSDEHIRRMKNTSKLSTKDLVTLQERYNSIFLNSSSYDCALYAAGSVISLVDEVLDGTCQSGVAIVRPPGHHAEEDLACGFCLFNNVSLAAKHALENHGLKRILIVDWDVHHGNGIQHMFDSDPRVLYVSIHRYDYGSFFPCSSDADYTAVGTGPGTGFNVNIPWNRRGMGDTEYLAAFTNIVLPIGYEYGPELVLVSAGFDAAIGDPLGGCKVSPEGYAHMTHLLSPLANGRIILALEGGYNLTSISYAMSLCTKALIGDPLPPLSLNSTLDPCALDSIRNVIETQSKFWKGLAPFQKVLPIECPVKPETYKGTEELVRMIEKLDIVNANSRPEPSAIPDPPTSAGEPSLSTPNPTPTAIRQRPPRPPTSPGRTENTSSGSGEMSTDQEILEPLGIVSAAAILEPRSFDFEELEGAVGGVGMGNSEAYEIHLGFEEDVGGMFAVVPLSWCPHLTQVNPVPLEGINVEEACKDCGSTLENWVCLSCYTVRCSRYVQEHMVMHVEEEGHVMALSLSDLSIWCFGCDSYVDNEALDSAKQEVYSKKFGLP